MLNTSAASALAGASEEHELSLCIRIFPPVQRGLSPPQSSAGCPRSSVVGPLVRDPFRAYMGGPSVPQGFFQGFSQGFFQGHFRVPPRPFPNHRVPDCPPLSRALVMTWHHDTVSWHGAPCHDMASCHTMTPCHALIH